VTCKNDEAKAVIYDELSHSLGHKQTFADKEKPAQTGILDQRDDAQRIS
jgi:hypothetical protein